jgi:hypothetical protein
MLWAQDDHAARDAAQPGWLQNRVAPAGLPHSSADLASSGLCRRLRLRPYRQPYAGGGWARQENQRTFQTQASLECFAAGSPSWLHKLGGVRGQSAADLGERSHEKAHWQKVSPWRACAVDGSDPLRPERTAHLEERIAKHDAAAALRPKIDHAALMSLARNLPAAWNAPGTETRTRQRIAHILIREVLIDHDDAAHEAVVTIHWLGGRHTELRIARVRSRRYSKDSGLSPVAVIRKLGGQWPDREVAVTMNRMLCKPADGKAWTAVRVRELREQFGIAPFDPAAQTEETTFYSFSVGRLRPSLRPMARVNQDRHRGDRRSRNRVFCPSPLLLHGQPPIEAGIGEVRETGAPFRRISRRARH